MRQSIVLLLLLAAGCAAQTPYSTTVGSLDPGSTMTIRLAQGALEAYHPASGEPPDRFTIAATAPKRSAPVAAPRLRLVHGGVMASAGGPLAQLLVRVPRNVDLVVYSSRGDVRVTDISGNADIVAGVGNVDVMLPGYARVHSASGNVRVRVGAGEWPGVLHFTSGHGDVEVWIRDNASFHAHLHTGNGTIFTDFNLRGHAQGTSETIDGDVNGGGTRGIDIETDAGEVRLLQLHPQA